MPRRDYTKLFICGDDIDTDRIIAGKYTKTLDMEFLASHIFEDLHVAFQRDFGPGTVVVAGENFGCGSSREQAPLAIKAAGVPVVIAASFARIFFRNAINIGLPLLELPGHTINAESRLDIDVASGRVHDLSQNQSYQTAPMPPFLARIIAAGGLVAFLRDRRGYDE